jgi:hypothetical protein
VVFLNGVVGEVDEFIVEVFHVELLGSRTDVAVLIPVTFLIAVAAVDTYIGTNVEFTLLVQEGHYVLLNYVGAGSALFVYSVCTNYGFDLL